MKIKRFTVTNLFSSFNHTITFNTEKGITIIIGENGLGKTIMLEMINSFFNKEFDYWQQVVFDSTEIEFEDGVIWKISIEPDGKKHSTVKNLLISDTEKHKLSIPFNNRNGDRRIYHSTSRPHYIERIGPDLYRDMRTGDVFDREVFTDRYSDRYLERSLFDETEARWEKSGWFTDRINFNSVHLVNTQRLLSIDKGRERTESLNMVNNHAKMLSNMIKSDLARSTEESSKLDRTFPNRLLGKISNNTSSNTNSNLLGQLNELEQKRKLLDRVGLIEISPDILSIKQEELSNNEINNTLSLYVEDSFQKLSIFNELSKKLELFINIINKRFKHKRLLIDKERGFLFRSSVITDVDKNIIPIEKLSSGEQNELVLFFELLFKSNDKSLILIDEPEISLHISWQNCFIKDLKEITKINNIDVLIATHSPDIIADNWDLRVELKGIE